MKTLSSVLLVAGMVLAVVACGGSSADLGAQDVVDAFNAAGLEADSPRPMVKDDYGLAPMVATEGIRFFLPSLDEGASGRIMAFDNQDDLGKTEEFYVTLGEESALFFSWTFVKDNILVQINGDLPEAQARAYEAALAAME